jgi:hypothetical protein
MSTRLATLNSVYTKRDERRRYEVWFLRLGLADGSGAWWFRYLLVNLGGPGCPGNSRGMPVQIWATWFPRGSAPQTFIKGFSADSLSLSAPGAHPFRLAHGENSIDEDACKGLLSVDGHYIRWDLRYGSAFSVTLSDRGRIGFSRTPHSDAVFSGEIVFDGRFFRGEPLGHGLQGHNCGRRHRHMWSWTHAIFKQDDGLCRPTFEALEYEMPLGMRFRKAVLWTGSEMHTFRKFQNVQRDKENLSWSFDCVDPRRGTRLEVSIAGGGPSLHRLPYLKTDCSGTFDVANNSLAGATLKFSRHGQPDVELTTESNAVLEMTG